MNGQSLLFEQQIAASLLILSSIVFLVAGFMFTARVIWQSPAGQTPAFLLWERSFVMAAFLTSLMGFVLLADRLQNAGDNIVARLALVIYVVSAVVVVVTETSYLYNREWVYPQIVAHVVLAFLAQATFGVALLRTGLVAGWVGWATIIWNLAWLLILPIARPQDMYYPWLHYVAPLMISIALLVKG